MARRSDGKAETTHRIAGPAVEPKSDLVAPGSSVGTYRIGETIAVGGFGTVYRAEHADTSQRVALKLLHQELATSSEAVLRFEREVEAVRTVGHPNVIEIVDVGSHEGRPYFVMELLEGRDLHAWLDARGRSTVEEMLRVIVPLCSALAAAHARGIVHRDIKASNVFLAGERVVLLDFGIAKMLDVGDASLTTSRHAVGTPACMAPEQIAGGEITTRTDVYGLGVLVYHMVTGKLPFAGASVTMMQHMHLEAERPRASAVVPGVAPLDAVLAKAMSRNPALRYPSVTTFLEEVQAALAPRSAAAEVPRSEPAIGVHLSIGAPAPLLESPDARLLDDIDAVALAVADGLEEAGFVKVLDTGTALLFVRRHAPDGSEAEQLRGTLELLRTVCASLGARPECDERVTVSLVVRSAPEGALLELGSWLPAEALPGIRVVE